MHLLALPPEILQQLLLSCTTPSFFQIIRTCKQLFQIAGSTRVLLLYHLDQVPGITLGLRELTISNNELFLTLRRRGAAQLIGSSLLADCTNFHVSYGTINPNASGMYEGAVSLALRDSLRVRLYEVEGVSCRLRWVVGASQISGIGKILKVCGGWGEASVLFSRSRSSRPNEEYLVERFESVCTTIEKDLNPEENAVVDTGFSSLKPNETYYYVTHGLTTIGDVTFRIPAATPWLGRILVPIDLTVFSPLKCAVLWDLAGSIEPSIYAQVITYTAQTYPEPGEQGEYSGNRIWPLGDRPDEERSLKRIPTEPSLNRPHSLQYFLPPQPQPLPDSTVHELRTSGMPILPRAIAFAERGQRIKLFAPGNIMPFGIAQASSSRRRPSLDDDAPDPFRPPASWTRRLHNRHWNMTTPFYSHHETPPPAQRDDANDGTEPQGTCTVSYLSLATTKVHFELCLRAFGTRLIDNASEKEVLCILGATKAIAFDNCTHLVDKSRCVSTWGSVSVVARLWGWQPSRSSLAGEHNLACCDTRVAVAEWDRVFIWSIDPKALIDEANDPTPLTSNDSDSDSESDDEPEPGETRRNPAWTYPKIYDANMRAWYVELKPIILSASEGGRGKEMREGASTVVIRQLVWKDENTLVVRTDRGLQIWNLGPHATGKRNDEILDMDLPKPSECMNLDMLEEDWDSKVDVTASAVAPS